MANSERILRDAEGIEITRRGAYLWRVSRTLETVPNGSTDCTNGKGAPTITDNDERATGRAFSVELYVNVEWRDQLTKDHGSGLRTC